MKNLKRKKSLIITIMGVMLMLLASCGSNKSSQQTVDFTEEQKKTILNQCIEKNELDYVKYLESKWFADGEIFDVEKTDDAIYVYAYLAENMYVSLNGKAYLMSGSDTPVKLTLEPETLKLVKQEYAEDGELYESSLKKLFTEEAYKKCMKFDATVLNNNIADQVKTEWKVEIDDNYQLEIDENGNYEVTVIDNDGSDGKPFEYHIEEKGKLEPR